MPEVTHESTFERQDMNYRISLPQLRMFPTRSLGAFFCLIVWLLLLLVFGGVVCLVLLRILRFSENVHPYGQKMSFSMKELERKEEGGGHRGKDICWIF